MSAIRFLIGYMIVPGIAENILLSIGDYFRMSLSLSGTHLENNLNDIVPF